MQTTHAVHVGDARDLPLSDDSVDLVVTSPPYPMIEMWDDDFAAQDPAIGAALERGDGDEAFDRMHALLDDAWAELVRVLREGGIACVNVGDATRTVDGRFRQFPNAAETTRRLRDHGLTPLPDVLWRKPTNSAAKFMGSGMLPPNAYPTLEHEHVLLFRNGDTRRFPPGDDDRYAAAYFWEERNEWFSDLWEFTGESQGLDGGLPEDVRERSGAFPFTLPFRLVCMFSVYGDTVLDPFWGTGTTSLAALVAGRSSVGVERDSDLVAAFADRVDGAASLAERVQRGRLADHRAFVAERREDGDEPDYEATHYGFPVVTKQERDLRLYAVEAVERRDEDGDGGDSADPDRVYRADHEPL